MLHARCISHRFRPTLCLPQQMSLQEAIRAANREVSEKGDPTAEEGEPARSPGVGAPALWPPDQEAATDLTALGEELTGESTLERQELMRLVMSESRYFLKIPPAETKVSPHWSARGADDVAGDERECSGFLKIPYLVYYTIPYLVYYTIPYLVYYTIPYMVYYTIPYLV